MDLILHKSRRWQGAGPTRALVKPANELISALSQEHLRLSLLGSGAGTVQQRAVWCTAGTRQIPVPGREDGTAQPKAGQRLTGAH